MLIPSWFLQQIFDGISSKKSWQRLFSPPVYSLACEDLFPTLQPFPVFCWPHLVWVEHWGFHQFSWEKLVFKFKELVCNIYSVCRTGRFLLDLSFKFPCHCKKYLLACTRVLYLLILLTNLAALWRMNWAAASFMKQNTNHISDQVVYFFINVLCTSTNKRIKGSFYFIIYDGAHMHSLVLIPVKLSFKQVKVRETSDITKQLSQTKTLRFNFKNWFCGV